MAVVAIWMATKAAAPAHIGQSASPSSLCSHATRRHSTVSTRHPPPHAKGQVHGLIAHVRSMVMMPRTQGFQSDADGCGMWGGEGGSRKQASDTV